MLQRSLGRSGEISHSPRCFRPAMPPSSTPSRRPHRRPAANRLHPTVGARFKRFSLDFAAPRCVYSTTRPRITSTPSCASRPGPVDLILFPPMPRAFLAWRTKALVGVRICQGKVGCRITPAPDLTPGRMLPVVLDVAAPNNRSCATIPSTRTCRSRAWSGGRLRRRDRRLRGRRSRLSRRPVGIGRISAVGNARPQNLDLTAHSCPASTDDIQGTSGWPRAVVAGGLPRAGLAVEDHRIVVFGAHCRLWDRRGAGGPAPSALAPQEAQSPQRLWMIDRDGLAGGRAQLDPSDGGARCARSGRPSRNSFGAGPSGRIGLLEVRASGAPTGADRHPPRVGRGLSIRSWFEAWAAQVEAADSFLPLSNPTPSGLRQARRSCWGA